MHVRLCQGCYKVVTRLLQPSFFYMGVIEGLHCISAWVYMRFICVVSSQDSFQSLSLPGELTLTIKYHLPAPNCPEYEHNIESVLLVSGSSASSRIQPTTIVLVATCTRAVCSVGLRSVGGPGACPES